MKTITKDGVSIFIFPDAQPVVLKSDRIEVGNPLSMVIGDCNANDSVLHENVNPPEDWFGHKYTFDGTNWQRNPRWVDPATIYNKTV